ncbi:sugar transferase [Butyrivibrio sp. MC2021]|uniref:sugar transferase n=1 Tax=Butyrivibrio sp. MC2021 TaxID=1408306 RepID=UPI000AB5EC5C|nr:sugar transferase [Butyrivibrio sp. MC2021]
MQAEYEKIALDETEYGQLVYMPEVGSENTDVTSVKIKKKVVYQVIKRVFDIVSSLIGLILLSPLFLVVAILIKKEDGGPVIFKQQRTGYNNKPFMMYKFRTMCENAPEMHKFLLEQNELDGPAFKMKDDPRITHIGKILRKTSIDELPQLLNILKGEMSVVGPRPLPVYETDQMTPFQMTRHLVKPGLTCYWQVMGRTEVPFDEWMELDQKYLEKRSIATDIGLIIMTFRALTAGDGAY